MAWSRSQPKSLCRCHLDNLSGRTAIFTEPTPAPPHETGPWLLSPAGCRRTGKPTPDPPPSGLPDLAFDADCAAKGVSEALAVRWQRYRTGLGSGRPRRLHAIEARRQRVGNLWENGPHERCAIATGARKPPRLRA